MPRDASALEIHAINVSQGDSFLIINRDLVALRGVIMTAGLIAPVDSLDWLPFAIARNLDLEGTVRKALLIDGGEDYYGGDVLSYIRKYGVKGDATRLNFMTLVSHFHSDHVDGVRSVYKRRVPIPMIGKGGWGTADNYPPAHAYDMGSDPRLNPTTGTYTLYMADVTGFQTSGVTTRHLIHPVARHDATSGLLAENIINLGADDAGVVMKMRCIASNGIVAQGLAAPVDIMAGRKFKKGKADQNDRSTVMVLEYGDFRCIFGGDAGGNGREAGGNVGINRDNRTAQFFSSHGDLETPLRTAITTTYPRDPLRANTATGHVCCFKSHHHGSGSSNDMFLISTLQPKIVLCSSGTRTKFHGHPTQEAINRMATDPWPLAPDGAATSANTIENYYITEMAVNGRYKWGGSKKLQQYTRTYVPRGRIMGDIVIRPFNVVSITEPNWTGGISMQVYGSGLQSAVDPGDKLLRAVDGTQNLPQYPVGPWEHTCNKH